MSTAAAQSLRRAYIWAALGQGTSLALVVLLDVARARLVAPAELGLFVSAAWLLGLVQIVGDAGLGAVVVSDQELDRPRLAALARVALLLAGVTGVVMLLGAPLMARWTGDPSTALVCAALVPVAVLTCLGAIPRAVLARGLDFRSIARAEMLASLVQLATTTGLALLGHGIWALVLGQIGGQTLRFVLFRHKAGPIWGASRDASRLVQQLRQAADITGSRALSYGYSNADYFVLSHGASLSTLATYFNAFRLATLPGLVVNNVLQQVSFSAFSAASSDRAEIRARFLGSIRIAALFAFPASFGLAVTADLVVRALYGPAWAAAGPVLQLLAISGLTRSLQIIGPSLLLAHGRTRANLAISIAYTALLLPAFFVGVRHGALGVAAAWAIVASPVDLVILWISARTVDIRLRDLAGVLARPCLRSAFMAVAAIGTQRLLLSQPVASAPALAVWLTLCAVVAVGVVSYGGWTAWAEPGMREQLIGAIRTMRQRVET